MTEVLVVGSANQDVVVRVARLPRSGETLSGIEVQYLAGGKGLNQACAARSTGVPTQFIGVVGADAQGTFLAEFLEQTGVGVRNLQFSDLEPTGTAHILVDDEGANQIVVVPGANSAVDARQAIGSEAFAAASVLVLQGEIPRAVNRRVAEAFVGRGRRVILNLAPAQSVSTRLLKTADPLVVNEHEAGVILGQAAPKTVEEAKAAASELLALSRSVIITLGSEGSVTADGASSLHVPAFPARQVVDTTGAGDAYVGVLAASLAVGKNLEEAATCASKAASLTVERPGAASSYGAIRALYQDQTE